MKNAKTTKGWPPKRREEQAARCKKARPWEKSTGPKTPEGKIAVKGNAYKHGLCSDDMKEINRLLRRQREFVRACLRGQPGGNVIISPPACPSPPPTS